MNLDASVIALATRSPKGFRYLQQHGIDDRFLEEEYRPIWQFITRCVDKYHKIPSTGLVEERFDWVDLPKVNGQDNEVLLELLLKRKKYKDLLYGTENVLRRLTNFEDIDEGLTTLKHVIESANGVRLNGHVHDPFSKAAVLEMVRSMKDARTSKKILTGLSTIDVATGGFRPKELILVGGRPGTGKSMLSTQICAQAASQGHNTLFYSLEMARDEVYGRIYTILSGGKIRNMALRNGKVRRAQLFRTALDLAPKYRKRLQIVTTEDTDCTLTQIEADIATYSPDIVWVDYLQLMPRRRYTTNGSEGIQDLTNMLKKLAMRYDVCIGICAQLNRDASGKRPSLEHIFGSDGPGQDASVCLFLNEDDDELLLYLAKNRSGPKYPKVQPVLLDFDPDRGVMREVVSE